jgi:hypothetical protein
MNQAEKISEIITWRIAGAVILKALREYKAQLPVGMRQAIRQMRIKGKLPPKQISEMDLRFLEFHREERQ